MIGFCKHFKREVLSESDCYVCIKKNFISNMEFTSEGICIYWTTKKVIRYKCILCRKNKFDKPNVPHICNGSFRKHKFAQFEKIVKYEGEK